MKHQLRIGSNVEYTSHVIEGDLIARHTWDENHRRAGGLHRRVCTVYVLRVSHQACLLIQSHRELIGDAWVSSVPEAFVDVQHLIEALKQREPSGVGPLSCLCLQLVAPAVTV